MRFEVISGSCTLNADSTCFMSPNYPYNYPNDASCTIGITFAENGAGYLGVRSFSTEGDNDFLRVRANTYSGWYGPVGAGPLAPGSLLTFSSDDSVTRSGASTHHLKTRLSTFPQRYSQLTPTARVQAFTSAVTTSTP